MSPRFCRVSMAVLVFLAIGKCSLSQTYPAATVTITGSQTGTASGTMTIAFNGHTHTVSYGQFSTASSIASAFAAEFSSYPASAWPRLCTVGVCAKANGATITFQLSGSASFGPITVTSTTTTGTNPFGAIVPALISLGTSSSPSIFGSSLTLTATVTAATGGSPTGIVTFMDGNTLLSQVPLSSATGIAVFSSSSLALGTHLVTATYSGDLFFSQESSSPLSQVISPMPIVSQISGISLATADIGGMVVITGSGFGYETGSVTVGGVAAPISIWNSTYIVIQIPAGVAQQSLIQTFITAGTSNRFPVLVPNGID